MIESITNEDFQFLSDQVRASKLRAIAVALTEDSPDWDRVAKMLASILPEDEYNALIEKLEASHEHQTGS